MKLIFILATLSALQMATEAVDRRLSGADPTRCLTRFLDYPRLAAQDRFVFNPDFWAKDIDFSCVSPWNSQSGCFRAGTLISKRHIIFAKHYPIANGTRLLFVGQDGGICPVRLEKSRTIGWCDIMIGLLDAEVTPNIHPAKILPPDADRYFGADARLPVCVFNQKEMLFTHDLPSIPTNGSPLRGVSCRAPLDEHRRRFEGRLITGDSGNPVFVIIGNEPVLLFCLKGGGHGGGPIIHLYHREIQAAMDELCPGYMLSCFDFTKIGSL